MVFGRNREEEVSCERVGYHSSLTDHRMHGRHHGEDKDSRSPVCLKVTLQSADELQPHVFPPKKL